MAVTLIAAMALFAYTNYYSSSSATLLRGSVERVASDVRLARDLAVSEGARFRVLFSAGSSNYTIEQYDVVAGTWSAATGTEQPGGLPAGILIQDIAELGGGVIIFDSLGRPYEGAGAGSALVGSGSGGLDHIVIADNRSGRTGNVSISPGSGLVGIVW